MGRIGLFDCYSILKILAGDVCFVNLFRSILPVVPSECNVLTVCRQHNDKEWKFKEQHAKIWEIVWGRKNTFAPMVSTLQGRVPPSPPPFRRLCILVCSAVFAELTDVSNRQADREIDAACVTRRLLLRHSLQQHWLRLVPAAPSGKR